jgi:hypothetical protein
VDLAVITRRPTLAEWPKRMVRHRKETLIARFGGNVLMPDVRHLIAQCAPVKMLRALRGVLRGSA